MSKNTERGIGLQDGSADGQTGQSATGAAGTVEGGAAREPSRPERAVESPRPAPAADSLPVTLLGVPSPAADRGKVTALGRDVHLPAETHRVATSRPVSVPEAIPGPQTARGSGVAPPTPGDRSAPEPEGKPEPTQPSDDEESATVVARDPGTGLTRGPSDPTKVEPTDPKPRRPTTPADRATIDASPLIVEHEPTEETEMEPARYAWMNPALRPSIALGIGMAFVLSIGLVSVVRYTTLEEGEEEPFADDSGAPRAAAVPQNPATGPSDQPAPTDDPTKAVAAGGAGPGATEAKGDANPESIRGASEKAQDPDKQVPAETLPLMVESAKETGKDGHRSATARNRTVAASTRRSSGEPEGATAGNDGAANARPANGRPNSNPANSNPANSNPTSPPPITPARTGGPMPGSAPAYDPDSPLPPAGE